MANTEASTLANTAASTAATNIDDGELNLGGDSDEYDDETEKE
jgi:hypothetical protein